MFQKELDILGQDSKAKYGLSSSAFHAANLPAALELCGKPLPIDSHSDAAVRELARARELRATLGSTSWNTPVGIEAELAPH